MATKYYQTDLSNLEDNVPTTSRDSVSHQHMVTYGLGFGAEVTIDEELICLSGMGALKDCNGDGWPEPPVNNADETGRDDGDWGDPIACDSESCGARTDDLWHAAYNGHGGWLSLIGTSNNYPRAVNDANLDNAFAGITDSEGYAAGIAFNSAFLATDTKFFVAGFDSADWSGLLRSFDLTEKGVPADAPNWKAEDVLDTQEPDDRRILTMVDGKGEWFLWSKLSDEAKIALQTNPQTFTVESEDKGESRLEFIRGRGADTGSNDSTEKGEEDWVRENGFRARSSKLGDIVGSAPVYVGKPFFQYERLLPDYADFKDSQESRDGMVYVSANDGMLHGFDATTGKERMAYIPEKIQSRLNQLTNPDYQHEQFLVNGPLTVGDVYYDGDWHTVLVGTLGAGGQGLFALDVTDPYSFDEDSGKDVVLWEFTDQGDGDIDSLGSPDLGYPLGAPVLSRGANGKWLAFFGNGYNNTEQDDFASGSGNAVLFVVDVETGKMVAGLDTKVGYRDDPGEESRPNGLATPTVVDVDNDMKADFVYAGDLFGNMWKFDIRDSDPGEWKVAFSGAPMFKARDKDGNPQPITTPPAIGKHPSSGYLVYFGTGQYMETTDNRPSSQLGKQTAYGIWDRNVQDDDGDLEDFSGSNPQPERGSNLLVQEVSSETNQSGVELRKVTDETITWLDEYGDPEYLGWMLDLPTDGERVVGKMQVRNQLLIFVTLIPEDADCGFGGDSWVMTLNAFDGGRPSSASFDIKGDGNVSDSDLITSSDEESDDEAAGGKKSDVGMLPRPAMIASGEAVVAVECGNTGECSKQATVMSAGKGDTGRRSWRRLQ